jgi:hypothetical protein
LLYRCKRATSTFATIPPCRHITISHMRKCTRNLHDNAIFFISFDPVVSSGSHGRLIYCATRRLHGTSSLLPPPSHGIDTYESGRGQGMAGLSTDWAATAVSARETNFIVRVSRLSMCRSVVLPTLESCHESLMVFSPHTNSAYPQG